MEAKSDQKSAFSQLVEAESNEVERFFCTAGAACAGRARAGGAAGTGGAPPGTLQIAACAVSGASRVGIITLLEFSEKCQSGAPEMRLRLL